MFVHVSASCTLYFLDLAGHEQHWTWKCQTWGGRGRNDAGDTNAVVSAPSTSIKLNNGQRSGLLGAVRLKQLHKKSESFHLNSGEYVRTFPVPPPLIIKQGGGVIPFVLKRRRVWKIKPRSLEFKQRHRKTEMKYGNECKPFRFIYTGKIVISLGETAFLEVRIISLKMW